MPCERVLGLVALVVAITVSLSACDSDDTDEAGACSGEVISFAAVEEKPELVGGAEGLQERLRYPAEARANGIEGTVFLQFVVNTKGKANDLSVLRSPHESLEEEALRLVRTATFRPGRQGGKRTCVRMSQPVRFRLE